MSGSLWEAPEAGRDLAEVYRGLCRELAAVSEDAAPEAFELCRSVCGIQRETLWAGGFTVSGEEAGRLRALLRRRLAGEPLQYLLGEWDFYGRTFAVGPGVLIPRADTETLAACALDWLRGRSESPRIADLCAGSGCLAITLALERPDASATALEKSPAALRWLRENVRRFGADVRVAEDDALAPAGDYPAFDLIVANPPYLSAADLAAPQRELLFEPRMALDGGNDGLDFYRLLPGVWKSRLKPGGMLALEVGAGQAEAVAQLLGNECFNSICVLRDICGIIRVVSGIAPPQVGRGTAGARRTVLAREAASAKISMETETKGNGTAKSKSQAAGGADGFRRG